MQAARTIYGGGPWNKSVATNVSPNLKQLHKNLKQLLWPTYLTTVASSLFVLLFFKFIFAFRG